MLSHRLCVFTVGFTSILSLFGAIERRDRLLAAEADAAATVEVAAQVIDLSRTPRYAEPEVKAGPFASQLSYLAAGDVKSVFSFHEKQLIDAGWKVLLRAIADDTFASATFEKQGFIVSLTVVPAGKPKNASVTLLNHGNVKLSELPLPADSKPLHVSPVSARFTSTATVEGAVKDVTAALEKRGWVPYGEAGPQRFFRKNAVRLSVVISNAPAQLGKSTIVYSSEQLSSELPAPADAIGLQYADVNHRLHFDTRQTVEQVVQFYRSALSSGKWEPTLDKPIKVGFRDTVIFRNPAKDLIELQMSPVDDVLRVQVLWSSAAEEAEKDRKAREVIDSKKMQQAKSAEMILLQLPTAALEIETTENRVEFKLATGTAKSTITAFVKDLEKSGWKLDDTVKEIQAQFGTLMVVKGDQKLSINYVDPGFIPAEVTIQSTGGKIELKKVR